MTHELVLTTADIERLSIRCKTKTCEAEVTFSFAKLAETPVKCPVCGDDWESIRKTMEKFDHVLSELKQYEVTFRVREPEGRAN